MNLFDGGKHEGSTIRIDGGYFREVVFLKCKLEYAGGDVPRFHNCHFEETTFIYTGAASNTVHFLRDMYGGGMRPLVEDVFEFVKSAPDNTASVKL